MTYTKEYIQNKLQKELNAFHVEVIDNSDGCGVKISCVVVSEKFKGKNAVEKHRLVHSVLKEELKSIHAFSQVTYTPEEWESGKKHLYALKGSLEIPSTANMPKHTTIKADGMNIKVSAPGKILLHGEHSVVYGRLALAASLGLRTNVGLKEVEQPDVFGLQLHAVQYTGIFDLKELKHQLLDPKLPLICPNLSEHSWEYPDLIHHDALTDRVCTFLDSHGGASLSPQQRLALKATLFLVAGILGSSDVDIVPMNIISNTLLAIGSGTGSSASFLVALAGALIQYVKSKKRLENFSKEGYKSSNWKVDMETFSVEELNMISQWAFCAEKIIHGNPSGVDNAVCTWGGLVEFRRGLAPKPVTTVNTMRVLLIDTKVPRDTSKMVGHLAALYKRRHDMVNNVLNAMEDVAFLALKQYEILGKPDVSVLQITKAYEELVELCSTNHHLLAALGLSHPRLDQAVLFLTSEGIAGAKLTGAGGGGHAFALIPPAYDDTVLAGIMAKLSGLNFNVSVVELGGVGVQID